VSVAASQDGGFWVTCFACGAPAEVEVFVYGALDGEKHLLRRGACALCTAILVTEPLPIVLGQGWVMLEVGYTLELPFAF
jgi:hypothetical protein